MDLLRPSCQSISALTTECARMYVIYLICIRDDHTQHRIGNDKFIYHVMAMYTSMDFIHHMETGVDGPWLQLVYLKIWVQIFQVLSQFLYEYWLVPTGWHKKLPSKFANPRSHWCFPANPCFNQPSPGPSFESLTFQLAYRSCSWRCLRPRASHVQLALVTDFWRQPTRP